MLIGLAAPSGSGKSAVARHLKRRHGFTRLHAGKPVKDAARAAAGLAKADVTERRRKDKPHFRLAGKTPRDLLEGIGEAVHTQTPGLTARMLRGRVAPHLAAGRDVVVDGIRDDHEAAMVRKLGGHVVGIDTGEGPDPALATDRRQARIRLDHVLDARGDSKKARRKAAKAAVTALLGKLA